MVGRGGVWWEAKGSPGIHHHVPGTTPVHPSPLHACAMRHPLVMALCPCFALPPCVAPSAWPFQRAGILEVLDFKPSPRLGSPIVVNGLPFMGASLGVTLWHANNAHIYHTDEGTVVWTRTHMFPMSFNNPGSAMPTVMPIRKGNKSMRRVDFDKLLVLGGSMWCQLIQHWVMEGLPLLEAAYDLINVRGGWCRWLRQQTMPGCAPHPPTHPPTPAVMCPVPLPCASWRAG